jgi:hypothetical protein
MCVIMTSAFSLSDPYSVAAATGTQSTEDAAVKGTAWGRERRMIEGHPVLK